MEAALFVQTIQNRQGVVISALEEIAYHEKWITKEKLVESAKMYGKSPFFFKKLIHCISVADISLHKTEVRFIHDARKR